MEEVFAKVKAINATGVSILMVEQKARQCLAIADYGYVLEQGRNRLEGPGRALLQDPEVIRLYLGVRRGHGMRRGAEGEAERTGVDAARAEGLPAEEATF
jgi:hypothetical protein